MENFTKRSLAVLWEVGLAENMCSPSVDRDAGTVLKIVHLISFSTDVGISVLMADN